MALTLLSPVHWVMCCRRKINNFSSHFCLHVSELSTLPLGLSFRDLEYWVRQVGPLIFICSTAIDWASNFVTVLKSSFSLCYLWHTLVCLTHSLKHAEEWCCVSKYIDWKCCTWEPLSVLVYLYMFLFPALETKSVLTRLYICQQATLQVTSCKYWSRLLPINPYVVIRSNLTD